jgi:imidazolonepropionase-like amidohydrolase
MEFALLIDNGMAPVDALLAATRNAADLLGAADRVGSVQPGRFADLVATERNPLQDASQFEHVRFVMKGGKVYRRDGAPAVAGE